MSVSASHQKKLETAAVGKRWPPCGERKTTPYVEKRAEKTPKAGKRKRGPGDGEGAAPHGKGSAKNGKRAPASMRRKVRLAAVACRNL